MKKLTIIFPILIALIFTSCVVVDNSPDPYGRDGNAYFGVDYEHYAPYSYWDNNNSIPYDPILGEYYHTNSGKLNLNILLIHMIIGMELMRYGQIEEE
jgi:hypothetical protein